MTSLELIEVMHEVANEAKAMGLTEDGLPPIADMQKALVYDPELGKVVDLLASKIKRIP